jgi:DNA-binding NtrC family response regulator
MPGRSGSGRSGFGADDLFAAAASEQLAQQQPLAARLRPLRLDDIVGQDELVGAGRPLRVLVESDRLSSAIFWGPPGTGKTTLAQVIARHTAKAYEQLSAVSASVKDVRETVARAEQRLGERSQGTILFLDEVHRFNKAQQDALEQRKRVRRQGLALRVTRRFSRGHEAAPNHSFCHAHVSLVSVRSVGLQQRER